METKVSSESKDVIIGTDKPTVLIGERINPTGRKKLAAELETGDLDLVRKEALSQVRGGADIIDVTVGAAGVDAVEGVCGPPQSDASLAQARKHAGDVLVVWGGIAQDFLLEATGSAEFEAAVAAAVGEARVDDAAIIGVADRVPVAAELARLKAIPELIEAAM